MTLSHVLFQAVGMLCTKDPIKTRLADAYNSCLAKLHEDEFGTPELLEKFRSIKLSVSGLNLVEGVFRNATDQQAENVSKEIVALVEMYFD